MGLGRIRLLEDGRHKLVADAERARSQAFHAIFATLAAGAAGSWRAVRRRLRHIALRRATYRELQGLGDRTLKDLGVYRGDIWQIADTLAAAEVAAAIPPADVPEGPASTGIGPADPTAEPRETGEKPPAIDPARAA